MKIFNAKRKLFAETQKILKVKMMIFRGILKIFNVKMRQASGKAKLGVTMTTTSRSTDRLLISHKI